MATNYRGACYEHESGRVWRTIASHTGGLAHDWEVASNSDARIRATIDREHDFGLSGPNGIATEADVTIVATP
jgi:hypothetical protein